MSATSFKHQWAHPSLSLLQATLKGKEIKKEGACKRHREETNQSSKETMVEKGEN